MANDARDTWREYQRLVLAELERHNAWLRQIDDALAALDKRVSIDLAALKVKSGLWGATAGIVVLLSSVLIELWLRK